MCVDTYPRELIPTAEDIRETLFERISASGWNDELFFTRNRTMQGLDKESRQCRRRTMSEVVTMPVSTRDWVGRVKVKVKVS